MPLAQTKSRPVSISILFVLIAFQGLSGMLGGAFLALDPTGESLHMPISMLDGSPFSDFFIPGLILLVILGIFPILILYGLWKKDRRAWFGSLIVGFALIIWISVEILMIGYHTQPPLQLIYGLVGFLIVDVALLPSVKKYFRH